MRNATTVIENADKSSLDLVRRRVGTWRWPRSVRQARAHSILAAVILWIFAIINLTAGQGNRSVAGPIKGADFVHFYTVGWLARTHQTALLYDFAELHRAQVALVPESRSELYVPVYPPQAALIFAPLTVFPYRVALLLWTTLTIACFAVIVYSVSRSVGWTSSDPVFVVSAAAAFPPFWSLVLHGQTTIVILAGFWAGWLALERRRPFLAGAAFGLLFIKPQFAIVLALTAVTCGEWALIAGALASIALQVSCIGLLLGWQVLKAYGTLLPVLLRHADLLEPKPFQMHSLSAVTHLMPTWIGLPLWAAAAGIVVFCAVKVWKSRSLSIRVRLGILMFASVLANPHVTIYDATILALPLIWIGAEIVAHGPDDSKAFLTLAYWIFVTLLVPTALAIRLQVSVLLMIWMFAHAVLSVLRQASSATPGPLHLTRATS